MAMLDESIRACANETWDGIVPVLHDYIAIPNVSPVFDPDWRANGHMAEAVDLIAGWCRAQAVDGLTLEVVELDGRTPVILMEIPAIGDGSNDDTVLLYGHLDKQPEMEGWREGLGPWTPVLEGDRLYGRGGADDGYAAFASLTAIQAVHAAGGSHARCVVLIESSEESGSPDLPFYIEALADRIGTPSLVICLDSGCIDYDRLWVTTSLRGLVSGTLRVDIVTDGLHSGDVSGMVPSTFRIARMLLDRVEDAADRRDPRPGTHRRDPGEPGARGRTTRPPRSGASPTTTPSSTAPARRPTIRPSSCCRVRGTRRSAWSAPKGLPGIARAGNVLRPSTSLKLSFRIPPTCDPVAALAAVKAVLEADPPYGARVSFSDGESGPGLERPGDWRRGSTPRWSRRPRRRSASRPARSGRAGRSRSWACSASDSPRPSSSSPACSAPTRNAHGPNEYLHLPTAAAHHDGDGTSARRTRLALARRLTGHDRSSAADHGSRTGQTVRRVHRRRRHRHHGARAARRSDSSARTERERRRRCG